MGRSPVNGVRKGEPLAGDGPTCDANTADGGRCKWPAGYGRDVENPEHGEPCFMHASGSEVCGAPVVWGSGCKLPAGYGTDHPGEGVCHLHVETVHQDRDRLKGLFLVAYDEHKVLRRACEAVGIAERTIRVWRKMDPEFDDAVKSLHASLERSRVRELEESMWERAVAGDASAAEVLFYLANRAPGRWQDLKRIRHEVHGGGGVLVVPSSIDEDSWDASAKEQQRQLAESTGVGGRQIEAKSRVEE